MDLRSVIVFAISSWALSAGCSSKAAECDAFAKVVNAGVEAMDASADDGGDDPARLAENARATAARAAETKRQIEALQIETEELRDRATSYGQMMDRMAGSGSEVAAMFDRVATLDKDKVSPAADAFQASQSGLEKACETARADCAKLAEVVAKLPESSTAEEFPAVLRRYVDDLGAVEVQDEATKVAVETHRNAAEAYGAAMAELNEVRAKLSTAQAQIEQIVAEEDVIVADLNRYCLGTDAPAP